MAALLRSARRLKFSPSGSLRVNGTNRTGPSLRRLFGGELCYRRTGTCPQTVSLQGSVFSRYGLYTAGCFRNFATAKRSAEKDTVFLPSKHTSLHEWTQAKLEVSPKDGPVTKRSLLEVLQNMRETGNCDEDKVLLLLRRCKMLMYVTQTERTEFTQHIWDQLKEIGVKFGVSHYNALLKVYLQNKFRFSPTDILAEMKEANVQPNELTYQRFINAYCQEGNIEGSRTILDLMKSDNLPINEVVFSSLVTGHARAGNIESAKEVLTVMKEAGIEPSAPTYSALLNAYAEAGDIANIKETQAAAERANCILSNMHLMHVISTLDSSGHQEHIPHILKGLTFKWKYDFKDVINFISKIIFHNQEDTAFAIQMSMPHKNQELRPLVNQGGIFLRLCVHSNTPPDKILRYCKELLDTKRHLNPHIYALRTALKLNKRGLAFDLMKAIKDLGQPIKPHYFWPLMTAFANKKDKAAVLEVLKMMQELDVSPDEYVFKSIRYLFPDLDSAVQAFKDADIDIHSSKFLLWKVFLLASFDLGRLHTLLSDPSVPEISFTIFSNRLLKCFITSTDVQSMVKLTELLCKDGRFKDGSPDATEMVSSSLIFKLVKHLSDKGQLQHQYQKLEKYLTLLQSQNITIPQSLAFAIDNILSSHELRPLLKVGSQYFLQQKLHRKLENEDKFTAGNYMVLIGQCCKQNLVKEALHLKTEMSRKFPSETMDTRKYIDLLGVLASNGKKDEAVMVVQEMVEKKVVIDRTNMSWLSFTLNSIQDVQDIQLLLNTILSLKLVQPSVRICSPVIRKYLDREDYSAALSATMDCKTRYDVTPCVHDILCGLMEKEDTQELQRAITFRSQTGDVQMFYDLFFAFLETGRYKEAWQIIGSPGLKAKPTILSWFGKRCIRQRKMEPLLKMVEMTAKLLECDRDKMYSFVFELCKDMNDLKTAQDSWTKMQKEKVAPSTTTQEMFASLLASNNVEYNVSKNSDPEQAQDEMLSRVTNLLQEKKISEACQELQAEGRGVSIPFKTCTRIIQVLLSMGQLDPDMLEMVQSSEAKVTFSARDLASSLEVISHSQKGEVKEALVALKAMLGVAREGPAHVSAHMLVRALAGQGDVAGVQEVMSLTQDHGVQPMVFINDLAVAHLNSGDVDSAVKVLEDFFMSEPKWSRYRMTSVLLEVEKKNHREASDKLSEMIERLANTSQLLQPALDKFLLLLDSDKYEDASALFTRVQGLARLETMLKNYMSAEPGRPGQIQRIKILQSLLPNAFEEAFVNECVIRCQEHVMKESMGR